ncbi:MAG: P-type Cu+ transporter [Bacteroidales bacterium]|jgi:Cu+-exporting ATPase|nr:P-type Cu+ transporter [Bacteroidales bacterium]
MAEKLICAHCGEDCGKDPVIYDGKPFCCQGCRTVYQLLEENKLGQYYTLMDIPQGVKTDENASSSSRYAFLDKEEIKRKLLEFSNEQFSRVTFYIPAIHCSSCIWLLENLHRMHPGIVTSMVNFNKKEVSVVFRPKNISLRQLADLLDSIHYAPEITLEQTEGQKGRRNSRILILQLGVAGFCFGNTMLFSFPEYFAIHEPIDGPLHQLFNVINLFLGTLAMLFSGRDYFFSAFKNLRHGILNLDLPIVIGMLALWIQSTWMVLGEGRNGYFDSLAGFVFLLLIGKWYQSKTYEALSFERDYKAYFPVGVTRVTNSGDEESILLKEIKPGDVLRIRNKELIPADGILKSGVGTIDYSFVTGESKPVAVLEGQAVFGGGRQIGESIYIEVSTVVNEGRLASLWNQHQDDEMESKSSLQPIINKISHYFVYGLLSISLFTLIFWLFYSPSQAIRAFVSVLIVACPCAIALTLPFTFGNTRRYFGHKGFYLKQPEVVEQLAHADTIVFDKTGTLTRPDVYDVYYQGRELSEEERVVFRSLFMHSTHPLSVAIYNYLGVGEVISLENYRELTSRGLLAVYKGIRIMAGSAEFTEFPGTISLNESLPRVYLRLGDDPIGFFEIGARLREGIDILISEVSRDYELHLISGDTSATGLPIGKWFPPENVRFRLSPVEKRDYIRELVNRGKRVIMIGDGLNDAGALSAGLAGISIADGVYHFTPASDAILEADSLQILPRFLQMSRKNMGVVRASLLISLIYNIIGLSFAARGLLSPLIAAILMPASSVSVVAFTTAATSLLAHFYLKKSSRII